MASNVWSVGVTTVPERRYTSLPTTLACIEAAGFPVPRLFVDGCTDPSLYASFTATLRPSPALGCFGNWVLGLTELLIRNPTADRFAMFQDDVLLCRNVRQYLDASWKAGRTYANLTTHHINDDPKWINGRKGWIEARTINNDVNTQGGKGAVAICFSREGLLTFLGSKEAVERPIDARHPRGKVDGCVVGAMNRLGWRELIHVPSLAQHQDGPSTLGHCKYRQASTFPGVEFDAVGLLERK